MKNLGKAGAVTLLVVLLYAGAYVAGRVGEIGFVLDDTTGYSTGADGALIFSRDDGGMITDPGRFPELVRLLNGVYTPVRAFDRAVTGRRFYWNVSR